MGGAPAAFLEYKLLLRIDPCAKDGGIKRWRCHTGPGLSVSGLLLGDGELAYFCLSQGFIALNTINYLEAGLNKDTWAPAPRSF